MNKAGHNFCHKCFKLFIPGVFLSVQDAVTVNDPGFTGFARGVAGELFGERSYIDLPTPIMGAEDFSYLLERWPGAMLFLGLRDRAIDHPAPCHSNRMMIDESGMVEGIALYAGIGMRYLASGDLPA